MAEEFKKLQRDVYNIDIGTSDISTDTDISNWDPIFVYLYSTKFPVTTLSLWELTIRDKMDISK